MVAEFIVVAVVMSSQIAGARKMLAQCSLGR